MNRKMQFKNIFDNSLFISLCLLEMFHSVICIYYYGVRCMGCDWKGENDKKYYKLLCDYYHFIIFNFKEIYNLLQPSFQHLGVVGGLELVDNLPLLLVHQ